MTKEVVAAHAWADNASLIVDVAKMYLDPSWRILDPTYGLGNWWTKWKPDDLVACDLNPEKSPLGKSVDFRDLPWPDDEFDAVAYDPPYKLNGTPSGPDEAYGVDVPATWQDRLALVLDGIPECARVLKPKGILLVKCMDQVVSGKVRWQGHLVHTRCEEVGLEVIDEFHLLSTPRPQPGGRRQVHARRNYSTLVVARL